MVGPQSVVVLGEEEQPCSIMQEQRFFTAFQAAVERQTGVVLPHSGVSSVQCQSCMPYLNSPAVVQPSPGQRLGLWARQVPCSYHHPFICWWWQVTGCSKKDFAELGLFTEHGCIAGDRTIPMLASQQCPQPRAV